MSLIVGVDPGLSGAIAILYDGNEGDGLVEVFDMPTAGGHVSGALLAVAEPWRAADYGTVVIEDVHAMPGQGVSSSFKFGRGLGVLEGVFASAGKPIVWVSPAKWKRDLGLSKDKGMSRRRAIETWPAFASSFARVKDDGRAEAALIAEWYRTHR